MTVDIDTKCFLVTANIYLPWEKKKITFTFVSQLANAVCH